MQESINDMEQYSQRECIEIKGVPLPDVNTGREDTDNHVMKIGKLMGVNIEHKDISVSRHMPVSKLYKGREIEPTIVVKFVSRNTKELFYRARKHLKDKTTGNLGYDKANKIYINEVNRKLFK